MNRDGANTPPDPPEETWTGGIIERRDGAAEGAAAAAQRHGQKLVAALLEPGTRETDQDAALVEPGFEFFLSGRRESADVGQHDGGHALFVDQVVDGSSDVALARRDDVGIRRQGALHVIERREERLSFLLRLAGDDAGGRIAQLEASRRRRERPPSPPAVRASTKRRSTSAMMPTPPSRTTAHGHRLALPVALPVASPWVLRSTSSLALLFASPLVLFWERLRFIFYTALFRDSFQNSMVILQVFFLQHAIFM